MSEQKFNSMFDGKEGAEGTGGDFNWGEFVDNEQSNAGAGGNLPLETNVTATKLDNIYMITGYIYPKKNYLAPSHDSKAGKEAYAKAYAKAVEEERTTYKEVKVGEDGQLEETDKVYELKDSFSLRALLALDPDSYDKIRKGYYKVSLQEKKAEFLILTNVVQLEKSSQGADLMSNPTQTEELVDDKSSAVSADKITSVIKLNHLIELAFDTQTRRIKIANKVVKKEEGKANGVGFDVLGFMVPHAGEVNRGGQYKISYKAYFFGNDNSKKSSIGDLGVRRACNRSYEGAAPNDLIEVTNTKQVEEFNPAIDPLGLKLVKKVPKSDLEPGTTLQELEEIPYEEQKEQWIALGVTEEMLASIRTSSSSSKTYDNAKIKSIYEEGFKVYMKGKNENSK